MKNFLILLSFLLFVGGCGRSPETLHRKGVEALNAGEPEKALRWLEKAAGKSEANNTAAILAQAGLAAARAGRGGDAESLLKQSLELDPANGPANYNLGDLLIQQNRLEEAVPYLEKAVLSGTPEGLEALAGIALRQGEMTEAYDYLQQARSRGENVRILTTLAVAGKGQLSVQESRRLLQKAVTLDPNYAPAQLNLAALLDQHRLDPAQAASHYEAFLRIRPEDDKVPLVQQRLGIMRQRQESGDFSRPDPVRGEIESYLEQAAEAAGQGDKAKAFQLCLHANRIATREQRTDLRERSLRAAATLVPDSARAQFGLGQFLLSQNRKNEAMIAMEKSRELAPGFPVTLRPTVLLAAELGRSEAATRMLQEAERAGAANPDMLLDIGDLYAEALNNERESRRVYQLILDRFPDDARRGEVQARLDR